jgi:hypothetical protein
MSIAKSNKKYRKNHFSIDNNSLYLFMKTYRNSRGDKKYGVIRILFFLWIFFGLIIVLVNMLNK